MGMGKGRGERKESGHTCGLEVGKLEGLVRVRRHGAYTYPFPGGPWGTMGLSGGVSVDEHPHAGIVGERAGVVVSPADLELLMAKPRLIS